MAFNLFFLCTAFLFAQEKTQINILNSFEDAKRIKEENLNIICIPTSFQVIFIINVIINSLE